MQDPCDLIPFSALLSMLFTRVNLQHQFVKALLTRQGARLTRFDKFHGLSLKLIVNYVTLDIIPNNAPLLVSLFPPRAIGCFAVVVAVFLIVSLIVAVVVYAPLFVAVPFLPLIGPHGVPIVCIKLIITTPHLWKK